MAKKNDPSLPPKGKLKQYTISVGGNLHKRVTKHVELLKRLENRSHSQQQWMKDALKEKLAQLEEQLGEADVDELKELYLAFKVEEEINHEVEKKIKILKNMRRSYSKKQLLIEAFSEKLDREESKIKELLRKKMANSRENSP